MFLANDDIENIYGNVIRIVDILRSLSFDDLIGIHNQAEYHQVNKLLIIWRITGTIYRKFSVPSL